MWKQILKTIAIAGTLDITAACIQAYLYNGTRPAIVLKYIASGLFGKDVFTGGFTYVLTGLLVHYLIVFAIVLFYFLAYKSIKLLHRNAWLSAFFIAIAAWAVTTGIIIPLSKITLPEFDAIKAIIAVGILYICIGLAVALFTNSYYKNSV
jgi:hypothetical protein